MLDVHFINVGKGSTTIIDPPSGRLTIIDIDDSRAVSDLEKSLITIRKGVSLTNPLAYLDLNFVGRSIFRFILTHPDMDHMSGIKELFSRRSVYNFWDSDNSKICDDWNGSPYNKEDWDFYQNLHENRISDVTVLKNKRGAIGNYWTNDGIEVLHPHQDLIAVAEDSDEYDHASHVLKFMHAGRSILIFGDATIEALEHIVNDPSVDVTADVILAPGHGSENHVNEDVLKKIGHKLTIVSVVEGVDYDRNFYSQFGPVLSTKHNGNIHLQIDDLGRIIFTTQANRYSDQWYILN